MMVGSYMTLGATTAGQVLYQGPPTADDLARYRKMGIGVWCQTGMDVAAFNACVQLVKKGVHPFRVDSGGEGIALVYRYNPTTNVVTIKAEASNNLLSTIMGWLRKACSVGQYADPRVAAGCALVGSDGGSGGGAGIVAYPTNAITAQNPATGLWHIAVPEEGGGLSGVLGLGPAQVAAFMEIEKTTTQPRGPTVVSWPEYKKAIPPWYKKPKVWIGIGAAAVVIGGGVWYLRRRRK
jgi:hypothetical protein